MSRDQLTVDSRQTPPLKGAQGDDSLNRYMIKWTATYKATSVAGSMSVDGKSEEAVKQDFIAEFPKANVYSIERLEATDDTA